MTMLKRGFRAVKQTGIDPSKPVPIQASAPLPPQLEAPQSDLLRGASCGAIGGDADKGVSIASRAGRSAESGALSFVL
jgi:hypothetical protein